MQVNSSSNDNYNKRSGDDSNLYAGPNKLAKTDEAGFGGGSAGGGGGGGSDDYSTRTSEDGRRGPKKSGASTTRTGQACDRCKVRKIRCDARPGGCSPCLQNNTECKTTDRITGRATSRGHTENLENENASLRMYMVELQQQLREHEIEPRPMPGVPPGYLPATSAPQQYYEPQTRTGSGSWEAGNMGMQQGQTHTERHGSQASLLPDFNIGCVGDNYLGVSSENNWLSPIKGTSLALFGMEIDLAKFTPPEHEAGQAAMSYETFLNNSFCKSAQETRVPQLPTHEQCKTYAEWYFRSIQTFIPILHKPDFFNLLDRVHHQGYQTNSAETVQIQLVLALIGYQYSARNANAQARDEAMGRFHYACGFIPELMKGHSLQDIQSLTLIASMLRGFPRPGATWMFTKMVLALAMELGLHRSAKAWKSESPDAAPSDPHTLEMRKRIWYSLLLFNANLSGRLGRPMPLRLEDFDIEFPEPLPDNLPSEENLSPWRKCSFRAGIFGFKLVTILMQVFSTIYSIRPSSSTGLGTYEASVKRIEREVEALQAEIPPELSGGPQTKQESRVAAMYINITVHEIRILLHHPALCRTTSPNVMADNLTVCLDASSNILANAITIRQLKSLDTTWYMATTFLAAIFTTLFAHTERRDTITSAELAKLRTDMDSWLEIVGDIGVLLGSGSSLQESIGVIVNTALDHIGRQLAEKTAAEALAPVDSPGHSAEPTSAVSQQQVQHAQLSYDGSQDYSSGYTNGTHPQSATTAQPGYAIHEHNPQHQHQQPPPQNPDQQQPSQQSNYPSGNHFAYPPPQHQHQHQQAYTANAPLPSFDTTYAAPQQQQQEDVKPVLRNLTPSQQTAHTTPPFPPQQHQQYHPQYPQPFHPAFPPPPPSEHLDFAPAGPAAWRHFADHMMTSFAAPNAGAAGNWGSVDGGGGGGVHPQTPITMPGVGIMGAEAAQALELGRGMMVVNGGGGGAGGGGAGWDVVGYGNG